MPILGLVNMFKIEISNKDRQVVINFGNIDRHSRKAIRRGSIRNARGMVKILKEGLQNPPKSGVKYKSLPNKSSAPGEYPATQSGTLLKSVKSRSVGLGFKFGYGAKHGKFLELGTKRRIAPRPGIQTTVNRNVQTMRHNYKRELDKNLGK